jgi:hypothetical protein
VCKMRCSNLTDNMCINNDRSNDCFLLTKNNSLPSIQCVDKV